MPRIPLIDIPNAPGLGPMAPAQSAPQVGVIDMSGFAKAAQRATLPRGSFNGGAEGATAVGEAISKVAPVIGELGERMMMSKNYADLARAEEHMEQAKADFDQRIQGVPEGEWADIWERKVAPKLTENVKALGLSGWAADRIGPQLKQFIGRQDRKIAYDVLGVRRERDKAAMFQRRETRLEGGEYEGAAEINGQMEALGHISPMESAQWSMAAEGKFHDDLFDKELSRDPWRVAQDLEKSKESESGSTMFAWKMFPRERIQRAERARAAVRQANYDLDTNIENGIYAGKVVADSQIREMAEGKLDEKHILALSDTLRGVEIASPEGQAKLQETFNGLWIQGEKYDPASDFQDQEFWSFMNTVRRTMPEGSRQELLEMVRTKRKAFLDGKKFSESSPALKGAFDQLHYEAMNNGLIQWKTFDKNGKVASEDPAARAEAVKKEAYIRQSLIDWARGNPGDAKDAAKVFEKYNALVSEDKKIARANKSAGKSTGWSSWLPWNWGKSEQPKVPPIPIRPEELKQKIQGLRQAQPVATPTPSADKSTSANDAPFTKAVATIFGYNDPEDNGVGAWGARTDNPDVMGASLSIDALREHFGDEDKAKGAMVEVRNPENGKTIRIPIVDKGPAEWVEKRQGRTIDLTHAASVAIGATGKTPVEFRILG